ncbi:MAG: radical SAM protein [Oscillospiraceae bacterium]|nr:radical SAM protein [Oscillospiraceae bacterium]
MRTEREGYGVCGLGTLPRVAKAMLHVGEEPPLIKGAGSGAVFFAGCTLNCVFCQNAQISANPNAGQACTPSRLAETFKSLEEQGASNINLVSGTPHVLAIISALELYKPSVPVVWNSSGYETVETIKLLAPYVDVWLPDLKYADDSLAALLSGADNYKETALSAITLMREISGEAAFNEDGAMTRGTIIRHLVLPHHVRNSVDVLNLISTRFPRTHLSLMGQFTPCHMSAKFGLSDKLSLAAWRVVKNHRAALRLDEGWNQPPTASGTNMIPVWNAKD